MGGARGLSKFWSPACRVLFSYSTVSGEHTGPFGFFHHALDLGMLPTYAKCIRLRADHIVRATLSHIFISHSTKCTHFRWSQSGWSPPSTIATCPTENWLAKFHMNQHCGEIAFLDFLDAKCLWMCDQVRSSLELTVIFRQGRNLKCIFRRRTGGGKLLASYSADVDCLHVKEPFLHVKMLHFVESTTCPGVRQTS